MTYPLANLLQKLVVLFTITLLAACATNSEPPEPAPEPEPVAMEPVIEVPVAVVAIPAEPEITEPEIPEPPMPNEKINFAFDSAAISDEEMAVLQEWADWINDSGVDMVEIHGHTDRIGTEQYNKDLSARRAQVTAAALKDIVGSELITKEFAHGEQMPLTSGDDELSRRKNRRVEIALPQMESRIEQDVSSAMEAAPVSNRDS